LAGVVLDLCRFAFEGTDEVISGLHVEELPRMNAAVIFTVDTIGIIELAGGDLPPLVWSTETSPPSTVPDAVDQLADLTRRSHWGQSLRDAINQKTANTEAANTIPASLFQRNCITQA
jgi:hypothetical protein